MIERKKVSSLAALRASYNETYARTAYGEKPALYQWCVRLLDVAKGSRVLDVGCGAGPFLRHVALAGGEPWGMDLAENALAKARVLVPEARLVQANGEELPFAKGRFDKIACLGNLEHFLDPLRGARELARVLAPGGRCLVLLPNSYYSGDIWRVITTGRGPDHHQAIDRFATIAEWRELLETGGLVVNSVERWDKGKLWKRMFPRNLAYHFLYVCTRV
ncbi:MAG TPA: class I SAM-dependent methyltransferase [Planctomycetota bacterium]|nr:class I SAM-dependent methyltransferase [Planctomycetota bacterium]